MSMLRYLNTSIKNHLYYGKRVQCKAEDYISNKNAWEIIKETSLLKTLWSWHNTKWDISSEEINETLQELAVLCVR